MDQFKLQMNWNQEELEQWAMASRQKEEDNAVLEKARGRAGPSCRPACPRDAFPPSPARAKPFPGDAEPSVGSVFAVYEAG